jgi:hypothetical protein
MVRARRAFPRFGDQKLTDWSAGFCRDLWIIITSVASADQRLWLAQPVNAAEELPALSIYNLASAPRRRSSDFLD